MTRQLTWTRRIQRLKSMSAGEIFDRTRQHLTARLDASRYRRGHDFTKKMAGNVGRYGSFFFVPGETQTLCETLKDRFPTQAGNIIARAEQICSHHFDLLGYKHLDYGTQIDWHLDVVHEKRAPREPWFRVKYLDFEGVGDSKITWELNRHQHLVTLAKAYRLTGERKYADEIVAQWRHWHSENPYPVGINWASSLEVAFRSLSWIWVYFLLLDTPALMSDLQQQWLGALALNGRHIYTYLSTYFSPNTHLLGEGVTLFFLGVLFPDFPRALQWQQRGWKILLECAEKQVRSDGFYFERSNYYHVYALDLFLHARILAAINEISISAQFDQTIVRMLEALCLLCRAGVPPTIGDDDGGRLFDPQRNRAEHLLDPLCTGSILFAREDFKFLSGSLREETLWLLGTNGLREFEGLKSSGPSAESAALREGGLYLMADVETGQQLTINAGSHGPGHGHADALSLTLIRNGRVLLIDPGTYEYVGDGTERGQYRGTKAHNTLCVDGLDQAEANGPFSWRKPPAVMVERWVQGRQFNLFGGSHDGYDRLSEPVRHQRWVFHRRGLFWLVRDLADGRGKHLLELTWHLGSSLSPVSTKDNLFAYGQESLGLVTTEMHGWSQSVHRGDWSPVYGHAERATVITFGREAELPMEFATLLLTDADLRSGVGRLERTVSDTSVQVYRYIREGQEHQFFFANGAAPWTFSQWASDAAFLYYSSERNQRLLIACAVSHVKFAGQPIITSDRSVDYVEVMSSDGKNELFSADPECVLLHGSLDRVEAEMALSGNDSSRIGI